MLENKKVQVSLFTAQPTKLEPVFVFYRTYSKLRPESAKTLAKRRAFEMDLDQLKVEEVEKGEIYEIDRGCILSVSGKSYFKL